MALAISDPAKLFVQSNDSQRVRTGLFCCPRALADRSADKPAHVAKVGRYMIPKMLWITFWVRQCRTPRTPSPFRDNPFRSRLLRAKNIAAHPEVAAQGAFA